MNRGGLITFINLPLDILELIILYLDVKGFLSLCATCRALQDSIRFEKSYWSLITRSTFRVPNRPAVEREADGQHWEKLYKRLLNQTKVFTWGKNNHGSLGHSHPIIRSSNYPREMQHTQDLGIIADLQCGGWSTTILTAKGCLFMAGLVNDRSRFPHVRARGLKPLLYPPGYLHPSERYDSCTAIAQFSSGRSHILGLADSGRIWSWASSEPLTAIQIKFLHYNTEISISGNNSNIQHVRKVVAGWDESSAYITGAGIVIWKPAKYSSPDNDTTLLLETVLVPRTCYLRPRGNSREPSDESRILGKEVGEVVNYILLEHFVVFTTDIGKVFAGRIFWGDGNEDLMGNVPDIIELTELCDQSGQAPDVQGAFRSLAILRGGEVLIAKQDYLQAHWGRIHTPFPVEAELPKLLVIPALQHTGVVSVAFGDWHFHALHRGGYITSYGTEPQSCGSLGLGRSELRGIRVNNRQLFAGSYLVQRAYTHGRRVWFEPIKHQWLQFLASGGLDAVESRERRRMVLMDDSICGEVSEWIEQEGTDWDKYPELQELDEDGLGAYFVLGIAAAGWHSGALVLVNDNLANAMDRRYFIEKSLRDKIPQVVHQPSAGHNIQDWLNQLGYDPQIYELYRWSPMSDDDRQDFLDGLNVPRKAHVIELDPDKPSPDLGPQYKWRYQAFPRLRLSDGRAMPGNVPFSKWRFGQPERDTSVSES